MWLAAAAEERVILALLLLQCANYMHRKKKTNKKWLSLFRLD